MQQLNLNEEITEIEPDRGFWRRQFQKDSTVSQKRFDWTFGVIMPIVCFVFDPTVFKGNIFSGTAELGFAKPFAYILSFSLIMAMSAWLIWGEKLKWLNAFLAGLFAVGAGISFVIGVILSPLSLIGLIIFIGILGFTPLLTAIVYFRSAFRAFQSAKPFLEKSVLRYSFVLATIFSFVVPYVVNVEIQKSINAMLDGSAQTIRSNARILKFAAPITNFYALESKCDYDNRFSNDEIRIAYKKACAELIDK